MIREIHPTFDPVCGAWFVETGESAPSIALLIKKFTERVVVRDYYPDGYRPGYASFVGGTGARAVKLPSSSGGIPRTWTGRVRKEPQQEVVMIPVQAPAEAPVLPVHRVRKALIRSEPICRTRSSKVRLPSMTDEVILEAVNHLGRHRAVMSLGLTVGVVSGVLYRAKVAKEKANALATQEARD